MARSCQKPPTQTAMEEPLSTATGAPLKWSAQAEQLKPWKNVKESKSNCEVTTITEGDLNDIENTIQDSTQDVVDEAMSDQQIVLGELYTQL